MIGLYVTLFEWLIDKMEIDDKICYCFHVSKRKIINYLIRHEPRVPSQLSECSGAGTGCGWCIPYLKKYFKEQRGLTSDDELPELTPEMYAQQRAGYIKAGKGKPAAGAEPMPLE